MIVWEWEKKFPLVKNNFETRRQALQLFKSLDLGSALLIDFKTGKLLERFGKTEELELESEKSGILIKDEEKVSKVTVLYKMIRRIVSKEEPKNTFIAKFNSFGFLVLLT